MPQNKDFALRIDIIDECLRNRFRKWTLKDLIDTVNEKLTERYGKTASKRTIQGDLKHMSEEKGAPIEKIKDGTKTYFLYGDKNYSIKNLPVRDEEIRFLTDAISILRQVNDFKILLDVDDIVNKLQNTVKTSIENGPTIIQFEKNTMAGGSGYIDDLFTAIKEKTSLRVSYQSFKADKAEQYVFHPYLLKEYRNRWFVIGRKADAALITNFALDRIKEIKNSSALFIENDLFDPETYFNNLIGVTIPEDELVQPIELKVIAKQAPYLKTKPIHHTQEVIKEYANGDIVIRLHLISNYELRSVLLGFGGDIEVLKPNSLRKSIKELLKEGADVYK
jgi:predicted DNA-binding transcriptional regulator YafY